MGATHLILPRRQICDLCVIARTKQHQIGLRLEMLTKLNRTLDAHGSLALKTPE